MLNRIVMVVSLVLVGCGGRFPNAPTPGATCTAGTDKAVCSSGDTAAYCIDGVWRDFDCYGSCGTTRDLCDFKMAKNGDPCPPTAQRFGFCRSSTEIFICQEGRAGILACGSCVTDASAGTAECR